MRREITVGRSAVFPGEQPGGTITLAATRSCRAPRAELRALRPDLWAVVLAGGNGTRLQGFVRHFLGSDRPKQFCRITGTRSMLRHTWDRAARVVVPDRTVTVITAGQEHFLDEEACRGVPGTVLVQPSNKETAPGLLLALLSIARRSPAATAVVFPADHFIWEEDRFAMHVGAAISATHGMPDRISLLGVEAERPETGYGWIAPGAPLAGGPAGELYAVRRFWEKPDRQTARRLFACGYLWNTLVLAGHLAAYLNLAEACVPEVVGPLRSAAESLGTTTEQAALGAAYARVPPTNLSCALLAQRPEGLMVLAARGVSWSDWGDPGRILRTLCRFGMRPTWLRTSVENQKPAAAGMGKEDRLLANTRVPIDLAARKGGAPDTCEASQRS